MTQLKIFIFLLISLAFTPKAEAQFGCTLTISTQSQTIYGKHLCPNKSFQVFEWDTYKMNLHFEEGQHVTFRIMNRFGMKTHIFQSYPFDANPVKLRIVFDGLIFQVACLSHTPIPRIQSQTIFKMDEDLSYDEGSDPSSESEEWVSCGD